MEKQFRPGASYGKAGYFFLAFIILILFGFYKSYIGIFPSFKATVHDHAMIHFHAALSMLWVILLIVQPLLIHFKKVRIHRLIGKMTYVVAPLLIFSFIGLIISYWKQENVSTWPFFEIALHYYFQVMHIIFFTTFYILAVINRKKTARHAAFMIGTGLIFINPIVRRVFSNAFGYSFTVAETIALAVTDIALVSLLIYAKRRNLNHKIYYLIMAMFVFYQVPMFLILYYFFPGQ